MTRNRSPQRIQLKRTKGWRMPDGVVVVARPSMWGNPWRVGQSRDPFPPLTPAQAVRRYEQWLTTTVSQPVHGVARALILNNLPQLRGKDLGCWCPVDAPCHADVLLRLANPDSSHRPEPPGLPR